MAELEDLQTISSTQTTFLNLPPSCSQFSPLDPTLLCVGTYFLNEATKEKSGEILLYRLSDNDEITPLASHPLRAVLDLQFSPHDPTLIALPQSHGLISFFTLTSTGELTHLLTSQILEPEVLLLSCAFHPIDPTILSTTLNTGEIAILKLDGSSVSVHNRFQPHLLEVWTSAFSPDGSVLYSGADDGYLVASDWEDGLTLWMDTKSHSAGVTAILPLPESIDGTESRLITGSYDERIRLINVKPRRRLVADEILGGGVWRLQVLSKPEGEKSEDEQTEDLASGHVRLLASCMHAGSRVVELTGANEWIVEAEWTENESMNYGSAWSWRAPGRVVSTSFYDKRVAVWRWKGLEK
ncbi:WD40 repeat-like protein [Ascobolus immersus RN42]|uniref:methylated diphthine methylhydrolase n=1 Tax=Ascobolus immersus RN42 TaxID=1160509 RepID=A0A3N4HFZ1_ASCIM|nr:WD40 repeat-like protein [Ascobolus immersus RN42]